MNRKRIQNSTSFTNVNSIDDDGYINLKSGDIAYLIEVKAIDLSLTSKEEKESFFTCLKTLYQISGLNLKCYKLDEKINLNSNKCNLDKLIEKNKNNNKEILLKENRKLIDELEDKKYTMSSIYYWVLIAKDKLTLDSQLNELEDITSNITPKLNINFIKNKLEIYKFLSNLYLTKNTLDTLMWYDLPSLISPTNIVERTNQLSFDDNTIQMVTIKNVPPFVNELFFEELFNYPNVRTCISIKDSVTQDELIRWVNSQYQFLLSDRNTTKKLSDATELDTQQENFQLLMQDVKNGDEKIKEVSVVLVITGTKQEREETYREIKRLVDFFQIKIDIPRLRQMEAWQVYDITTHSFKDYAFYLPTLTLAVSFPFTKSYFNDSSGYMLGVDIHTSLPTFFDPYVINNSRTSHNMAIISSTGGGKSYTMKKLIVNEYAKNTKVFVFDADK